MPRIFLLSPANTGGTRGRILLSDRAKSDLAVQLRSGARVPICEVFSFLSGLYFRGKITYAMHFGRPPRRRGAIVADGAWVITPSAGLLRADTSVTLEDLKRYASVDVSAANAAYRKPLERTAHDLVRRVGPRTEVVLLGSIASAKYVDVLTGIFGARLLFPIEFVGRGDMSRGGLLLRCVRDDRELEYVPLAGAVRHGPRPPKLEPIKGILTTFTAAGNALPASAGETSRAAQPPRPRRPAP